MQILNNQTSTFKALHVQSSKMTKAQKRFTEKAVDMISYSDSYAKASNKKVDICITSPDEETVKVFFLDHANESFFRNTRDNIVTITSKITETTENFVNKIVTKLDCINQGKYKSKLMEDPYTYKYGESEMYKFFDDFSPSDIDVNPMFIESYKKF